MKEKNTDTVSTIVTKKYGTKARQREMLSGYLFILPFMLFLITFSLLPIIMTFIQSFQTGGTVGLRTFVGLQNYVKILTDRQYYDYLLNNFLYIIMSLPVGQFIAFGLALYLKKTSKLSPFFETVYFMPLLISMVAASMIMSYMFSVNGPINYLLEIIGIDAPNWLNKTETARIVIVILEIWKGCTFYIYIYVAALRGIPNDFYEVGLIEGANPWQMLRKVTLPLMRNSILLCIVMSTIWQLQLFDSVFTTTNGGPLNSTKTVVFAIYELTFKNNLTGLGAALSMLFLLVILLITALQLRLNKGDIEY